MSYSETDFARAATAGHKSSASGPRRSYLRLGLGSFVALASCMVLSLVWDVAGDENRRQAIAAARALVRRQSSIDG